MDALPLIFISFLGLCAGSFALVLATRMYAGKPWVNERSECDHCHKTLQWYDLVPLISWLSTRGMCRYCKKRLGPSYPLVELASGIVFALSYVFWPYGFTGGGIVAFGIWLVMLTLMVALVVFDLKWFLLPDKIVYPLIGIALASKLFWITYYRDTERLIGLVLGVLVGWGVFNAIYLVSKGKYIGGGDVKLGLFFGILLASGFKSLLVISIGSLVGTIMVLPSLVSKKTTMTSHIPFGPSLIIATFVVYIFGDRIIELLTGTYLFP